jgi:hypothetical protein
MNPIIQPGGKYIARDETLETDPGRAISPLLL